MKHQMILLILTAMLSGPAAGAVESLSSQDYQSANRSFGNHQYAEALSLYRKALTAPPAGVAAGDIQQRIGDCYFKLGEFPSALAAYRAALADARLKDKAQAQYFLGFCCFLTGRDADAVTELLKVPALYPEAKAWASTSYYWAGRASERMGRKDQAAEYYRKAGGSGTSTQGRFAQKKAESVKKSSNDKAQSSN